LDDRQANSSASWNCLRRPERFGQLEFGLGSSGLAASAARIPRRLRLGGGQTQIELGFDALGFRLEKPAGLQLRNDFRLSALRMLFEQHAGQLDANPIVLRIEFEGFAEFRFRGRNILGLELAGFLNEELGRRGWNCASHCLIWSSGKAPVKLIDELPVAERERRAGSTARRTPGRIPGC